MVHRGLFTVYDIQIYTKSIAPGFVSGIMRVCVSHREGRWPGMAWWCFWGSTASGCRPSDCTWTASLRDASWQSGWPAPITQSQCFSQSHKALQVNHCVMHCHEKEAWLGKRNQESCSRPHTTPSSASGWDQSPPKNWSKFKWTVTTYRTAKPKLHTGEIKPIQKWNVMTHDTDSYSI